MSRSQGAYAHFYVDTALDSLTRGVAQRMDDLSPVMEPISKLIQDEMKARLARGGDGWAPFSKLTLRRPTHRGPGIGEHGGFAPTIQRSWSKRNAVGLTRAPHAHLFDEGTTRHLSKSTGGRVNVFSEGRRHVARPQARRRLAATRSEVHQPERPFAYLSPALQSRASEMVIDFVLEGSEGLS
jgi:hypothetical protein